MSDKQKIYLLGILSFVLLASSCYAFFLYLDSRDSVLQLTSEISQLQSKIQQLQCTSKLARNKPNLLPSLNLANTPTPASVAEVQETQTKSEEEESPDTDAKKPLNSGDWAVKFQIQRLEQFTGLNDDQRARLEAKFRAEQNLMQDGKWIQSEEDSRENNIETLSDILGPEMATQYQEEQKQAMEKFKAEHTDQEVFTYARKLSLSPEQEDKVRASLEEVDKQLADDMQKDLTVTDDADSDKKADKKEGSDDETSPPLERFQKMREKRRALLNEKLKPILTDDQYNRLLEDQATGQRFPFVF